LRSSFGDNAATGALQTSGHSSNLHRASGCDIHTTYLLVISLFRVRSVRSIFGDSGAL
jgi:hypothetical protein